MLVFAALVARAEADPKKQPDESRARELFVDICTSCHTLERVHNQAFNKAGWAAFIRGMVSEGAAVSEEEMDLIAGYLGRHYGDGSEKEGGEKK